MKDYETMAESVLKRRDDYVVKRRSLVKRSISAVSTICIVALVGVGVSRAGVRTNPKEDVAGVEDLSGVENLSGYAYAKEEMQTNTGADESSDLNGDSAGSSVAGVADYEGNPAGDSAGYYSIPAMITSFGETKMESDISVNNGAVVFSDALMGAMEQYGGDVKYRVIVELFSDGTQIDCAGKEGKKEMQRFAAEGYTVAFESYNDGYVDHNYFTLHATAEQLDSSSFPASEQYGYCVLLYGERIDDIDQSPEAVSGGADVIQSSSIDAPVQDEAGSTGALNALDAVWGGSYMDENGHWVVWLTENTPENQQEVFAQNPNLSESTTTFKQADYSLAYLTDLMAAISKEMGDGELSFVSTAALMEDKNRVEVTVTTEDEKKIAQLMSYDSIGGAIEIRNASVAGTDDLLEK
jgi:hypothetical protein